MELTRYGTTLHPTYHAQLRTGTEYRALRFPFVDAAAVQLTGSREGWFDTLTFPLVMYTVWRQYSRATLQFYRRTTGMRMPKEQQDRSLLTSDEAVPDAERSGALGYTYPRREAS